MEYILVVAALYNLIGAFTIWFQDLPNSYDGNEITAQLMQFKIFTGGTASIFGLVYLYVFFVPSLAIPLLVFGIALKTWSFISCFISFKKYNFPKSELIKVGIGNLIFAVLFLAYLLAQASGA